jgi:hypothetical protein
MSTTRSSPSSKASELGKLNSQVAVEGWSASGAIGVSCRVQRPEPEILSFKGKGRRQSQVPKRE